MSGYEIFKKFENEEFIFENEFYQLTRSICGQLNSYYNHNRHYFKLMYNYSTRLYIVCRWRKKNNFEPKAKLGENICDEKKTLVNYFKNKSHRDCCCLI